MTIDGSRFLPWLEQLGLNLLAATLTIVIGIWVSRRLARGLERILHRSGAQSIVSTFVGYLVYAALLVVTGIIALQHLSVPVTSIVAVLGAAGLAIALAMKDSLSNIAAGIMLVVLRPFRDGDTVQIAGHEGTVEQIRVFQTRLRTADNRVVVLPNSSIATAPIINLTAYPRRRIEIALTIPYEDDLATTRQLLLEIANGLESVLDDPPPAVTASRLGEQGVDVVLHAWAKTYELGATRTALIEGISKGLPEHGLSLPNLPRSLRIQIQGEANDAS